MARRIFRESALRRYNERLEKIELPRYATASWTLLAWVGVVLLLLFAALLLAAQLPVYAAGPGVVVSTDEIPGGAAVAALLPAEFASQLKQGQIAEISLSASVGQSGDETISAGVTAVEPRLLSPAAVRAKYGLDATAGSLIDRPVVVALIAVEMPVELWEGSVAEVQVAVGARSGLSLLPGVGRLMTVGAGAAESGQ